MALICHKIVTKCSILHGGKGPGSPPDYNGIWQKSILICQKTNSVQYSFMQQKALYGTWKILF